VFSELLLERLQTNSGRPIARIKKLLLGLEKKVLLQKMYPKFFRKMTAACFFFQGRCSFGADDLLHDSLRECRQSASFSIS
jgi:hypothetical protein